MSGRAERTLDRFGGHLFYGAHEGSGKAGHFFGFDVVTQNGVERSSAAVVNGPKHRFILACRSTWESSARQSRWSITAANC